MVPSLLMTPSRTHFKIVYNYSNKLKENACWSFERWRGLQWTDTRL